MRQRDKTVKAQRGKTLMRRNIAKVAHAPALNAEARYRLVIEAVAEGIYEWSTETNHLELSTRLIEMFGFERGELTSASWLEHVHSDDRNRYRDATVAYFKGLVPHLACEYRILNKSGQWRWVSDRASSIRDADGRVVRLIGAITDISELKSREAQLRESLQQQTATADMLKAISRSAFDLQTVLDTLVESVTRLCEADHAWLFQREGECFRWVASYGHATDVHAQIRDYFMNRDVPVDRGSVTGRTALEGRVVHIPDVLADPEYTWSGAQKIGGYRAALGAPLLHKGKVVGVIFIVKTVPQPFTAKQIELATTFADQAVIAIENTRLLNELRQRTDDLSEALEQQTATSEVLQIISRSPGELEPVFNAMLANATRICEATFGNLFLHQGHIFRAVAVHSNKQGYDLRRNPVIDLRDNPGVPLDRVVTAKQVIHIPDLRTDQSYIAKNDRIVSLVEVAGARTFLLVPMLKDDELIGAIVIYRQEVRPFTDKQIELVKSFAAQAVIAIENTRLLNELRKSLQQQTATADVLKVISRSTFDLQVVFKALVNSAAQLCRAKMANIALLKEDGFEYYAAYGFEPDYMAYMRSLNLKADRGSVIGRAALEARIIHIHDVLVDSEYATGPGHRWRLDAQKLGAFRTALGVPLLREGKPIGAMFLSRDTVEPFTQQQIDLVSTFAAQAVIAIENTRLLSELRQRTDDLTESLEQQTATSEILEVISNSPTDTQPAFDAIVRSGLKLFPDAVVAISLPDRDLVKLAAIGGADEAGLEALRGRYPMPLSHEFITGTAILDRREIDLADAHEPPKELTVGAQNLLAGGYRAMTVMPMMRGDETIGALNVIRRHPGPLSDKQRELLRTFANQAVIAIENTRLFNELRESLQQQTATADVLKVISRSTFDLQTVLNTLTESAARLCEADMAAIIRQKGAANYWATSYGFPPGLSEYLKSIPIEAGRGTVVGRVLMDGKTVHVSDVLADAEYTYLEVQRRANYRTMLGIPLLREGMPIGIVLLMRHTVRPFAEKQIELAETFADQAVIAIENVRLFESVEARTRELAKSLEDLQTAQDRLVQTEKLASLGQLTAGIAHEIKNPLNFVNNFSAVSVELIDELRQALAGANLDNKLRAQISEVADMLQGNLDKVVQHGKRADAIVKNMLLHSRQGSGEHRPVDVNALVEESLNLAYHGARAEKQGFNITLERSLDPTAGEADVFPQEITRALLNLISNGFYAATKRKAEANGGDYEPTLSATTKSLGDRVEIRIRDNGTGIPPEVKEKLFNPFFTTKPAGEGTGLGLSISHDIIVKQHGGSIEVDTRPGEFTEITIVLPRAGASLIRPGERP